MTVPPVTLFLSSLLGAFVGEAARLISPLFDGIIAFGMVGLLYLVCCELLIAGARAVSCVYRRLLMSLSTSRLVVCVSVCARAGAYVPCFLSALQVGPWFLLEISVAAEI